MMTGKYTYRGRPYGCLENTVDSWKRRLNVCWLNFSKWRKCEGTSEVYVKSKYVLSTSQQKYVHSAFHKIWGKIYSPIFIFVETSNVFFCQKIRLFIWKDNPIITLSTHNLRTNNKLTSTSLVIRLN